MQWNDSANAGFSTARPWLPVPASYKSHNVASELADPSSVLQFYKQLLALRHKDKALLYGDYVALNPNNPNILSYLRRYKGEAVLVVLNMSSTAQPIPLNLSDEGLPSPKLTTLLSTSGSAKSGKGEPLPMDPFSVYIARVSR